MTTIMSDVIAGRIELLDPLARGASGSLWRAIDRRYGAICAAKVMRQRDGAEVLRFVREQTVGTAQGLGAHPHLLPPYTWVAEDDTVVLVMPLVHGGTLAGALADHGALSPSLVAQLLRQLLDALDAMHTSQWVHRDVKPANLLLDATGDGAPHLLLADFGIALHVSDVRLTETGFVHGTPGFMAPEILAGGGTSAAQDVWAAAACALEALAPLPPRERPSPSTAPQRVTDALSGSSDPAAAPLGELLRAMLATDPARRPSAARARDTIPLLAEPVSAWSRTAEGERFEVVDRIEAGGELREVPLDGPASLAGLAPGLHERLQARSGPAGGSVGSAGSAGADGRSAPSPDRRPAPGPQRTAAGPQRTAAGPQGATELFVHEATPQDPHAQRPVPNHVPNHVPDDAPNQVPDDARPSPRPSPTQAPRSRRGAWVGVLLLVISLLCLIGAGALVWTALG
ncbi:protein kinase domain-containing protein [Brachybacterium sp. AOP3-A1-3]|uniref:protein kinase domain-containing protein n=1 Tax=Brachybacterium sp. AOP3-A1-3 TaxID=3457699 RepID=UPI0040347B11